MPPGTIYQRDFSGGWNPSVDPYNAPENVLLRADSLTWDQRTIPRLRAGSQKLYQDPLSGGSVHSLFTTLLNAQRKRLACVGDNVYQGSTLLVTLPGSGDASFGAHMGQILMARGADKRKWDGTTVRNWGLPTPASAATLSALTGNTEQMASCDAGDGWTAVEGTIAGATGYDGAANGARRMTADGTTFRAVIEKVYSSDQNFDDYAGTAGADTDLVEFYLQLTRLEDLLSITFQVDVNSGSAGSFQDDYYYFTFKPADAVKVRMTPGESLGDQYDAEAWERERAGLSMDDVSIPLPRPPVTLPPQSGTWVRFSVPRGKMLRVGSTAGKNWSTVKALRFIAQFDTVAGTVDVDNVAISGGVNRPLTGKYTVRYCYVYDSGVYEGKGPLSSISSEIEVRAGAVRAVIPASGDSQVNETWVFLMGGALNRFYRVAVRAGDGGTVDLTTSERDAVIANVTTEDNSAPPNDPLMIAGPHYDRTFVLTATRVWPSRRGNPDSFAAAQALIVGDATELPYWIIKMPDGNLYVGTSKNIYRVGGVGQEFPDGTTDFRLDPVNVEPAIDAGVCQDGFTLYYIASDGWRAFSGGNSQRVVGVLDLLYKGYARYGVQPVNLGSAHARFRCAFFDGRMYALSGEGGGESASASLHVFDGPLRYRYVYPFNIVALYREPDGKILAGCDDGHVRQLETGTDDDGARIDWVLWTKVFAGENPLQFKDPFGLEFHGSTGGQTATIQLLLDSSETVAYTTTLATLVSATVRRRMDGVTAYKAIQARVSGRSNEFTIRELSFSFRLRPQPRLHVDTGYVDTGRNYATWVRRVRLKCRAKTQLTVTPYFDDVAFAARTVSPVADRVTHYELPMPRGYKGRQPRIVVNAADDTPVAPATGGMRIDEFSRFPSGTDLTAEERIRFATVGFAPTALAGEVDHSFEMYWIEFDFAPSGNETQNRGLRVPIG